MVGVEAGGYGLASGQHSASITAGSTGILHGCKTFLLQDDDGQVLNAHSISAGLDYPGVGPEHALWAEEGRVSYATITDKEALEAFHTLTRLEGILPALESSHAIAEAMKRAAGMDPEEIVLVNLSGRGDKDVETVLELMKEEN
jgi:tryptophan synthase beta chain